jgi:glutathione peroxidase-family protein
VLQKFLVNAKGEVVQRFSSVADPITHIEPEVVKLLAEAKA